MFKRIALLVMTNLVVVATIMVILSLLGVGGQGAGRQLQLAPMFVASMVIGFTGAIISLLISKPMAKWTMGCQPVDTSHWLYQVVATQAERAGLRTPEVCIYEAQEPNAFATGAFKNSALIAVSTGLLNKLTRDEVKAVLGHEVGHIANGDMVTATLLQGILNTFVVFFAKIAGWVVDRTVMKNENDAPGVGYYVTSLVMQLTLGLAAGLIQAWYSRRREFVADRAGADLTSHRDMANALRRLGDESPSELSEGLKAFGIRGGGGLLAAFSTHPPIEERIKALEEQ